MTRKIHLLTLTLVGTLAFGAAPRFVTGAHPQQASPTTAPAPGDIDSDPWAPSPGPPPHPDEAFAPDPPSPPPGRGRGPQRLELRAHPAEPEPGPPAPLSEQRIEELLGFLQKEHPEMHRRLLAVRERNPRAFHRMMGRLDHAARRMEQLPPKLREMAREQRKLRVQGLHLMKEYRATDDPKRQRMIRDQVAALVARDFDIRQEMKAWHVEQLARRLDQLKREIDEEAQRRETIIAERVEKLMRAMEEYDPQ